MRSADAVLPPGRSLIDDCVFLRVPTGDGGFPVTELLQQLHRIGGLNRCGPEILPAAIDRLLAEEIGARCQQSLAASFERAGLANRFEPRRRD